MIVPFISYMILLWGFFALGYFGQGDASFCDAENEIFIVKNSGKRWYKGKNHVLIVAKTLTRKWGAFV